ncbi:MAG: type III-B CRISPR module RAMP protein Cmr4, partial [Pirellulales bacterium]
MSESTANGQHAALLFLHAQTAIHPGAGTALGVIDLPVQRERHTQWPVIAGSAIKGILRDVCRERAKENYQDDGDDVSPERRRTRRRKANEEDPELVTAFGPGKVDDSSAHAGSLVVTDARILAFPVRSLSGVFAWTTCPALIGRLRRDLALAGIDPPAAPPLKDNQAACPESSPLLVDGDKLVLEEFEFTRTADAADLADWISKRAAKDESTQQRIKTHLAVLSDNDFCHFVRPATEVVARIGLDYERKTVRSGALFYQEFLPAETIFYSVVLANNSRNR